MPGHTQRTVGDVATFVVSFPARMDSLVGARHDFSAWLRDCVVNDDARDDLSLVFSELGANAVEASTSSSAEVLARASWDGSDMLLEIVNPTSGTARTARGWDVDDPLRERGRGLMLVQEFVDRVEVDRDAGGHLVVRCRRRTD